MQLKEGLFIQVACGKLYYRKENPPPCVPGRDSKVLTVSASEWENNKKVHLCKVSCQHRTSPVCVFTFHLPRFRHAFTRNKWDKRSKQCFGICLSDQMTLFDGLWMVVQIKTQVQITYGDNRIYFNRWDDCEAKWIEGEGVRETD